MRRIETAVGLGLLIAFAGGVLLSLTHAASTWYFAFGLICTAVVLRQALPALLALPLRQLSGSRAAATVHQQTATAIARVILDSKLESSVGWEVRRADMRAEWEELKHQRSGLVRWLSAYLRLRPLLHAVALLLGTGVLIAGVLVAVFVPVARQAAVSATVLWGVIFALEEAYYVHDHIGAHNDRARDSRSD